MKRLLGTMRLAGLVITCVIVIFDGAAQAEKNKISGTDKVGPAISETSMSPGDVTNHRLVQAVRRDTSTSSDPEFNETEVMVYQQDDVFATGAVNRGYSRRLFKNGDITCSQNEGTVKITVKGDGSREITWEGRWQATGGTGKFKNVKGSGTYRGKVTGQGAFTDWESEIEY